CANRYHLAHIIPTSGRTRVDHVLANPGTRTSYHIHATPFKTDHPLLSISISPLLPMQSPGLSPGLERYRLAAIENPLIRNLIRQSFETQAPTLNNLMDNFFRDLPILRSVQDRRLIINGIDDLLSTAVGNAAAAVLGTYRTNAERARPDKTTDALAHSNKPD